MIMARVQKSPRIMGSFSLVVFMTTDTGSNLEKGGAIGKGVHLEFMHVFLIMDWGGGTAVVSSQTSFSHSL